MFLNKLTGTQIGMTAWDMFVINKPTVLTVSIKIGMHSSALLEKSLYPPIPGGPAVKSM